MTLLLAALAHASTCPAPYDREPPRPGLNRGFTVAGQARSFWLMLPETKGPAPLFVAFNGTSEDGAAFAARARLQDFVDRGFVVVAPSSNGNGTFWPVWDGLRAPGHESDPNPDVALFDTLLACLPEHVAIDRERVYVGGHSAGGIFTNHLLQRRSDQIAGAIVGSGVYSQTSPSPMPMLAKVPVIVTWGGENDAWSGRAGSAAVSGFSFASEAAVATQAYARAGLDVVACKGKELGHAWLDGLNDWMIDLLLAHRRGTPITTLPALPKNAEATCTLGPVTEAPNDRIVCGGSSECHAVCQAMADGMVTNRTLDSVLAGPIRHFGFEGESCDGCLAWCEQASEPGPVLACMATRPAPDPAVGGVAGAMPLIDAVNTCCDDHGDDPFCQDVCGTMRKNLAARAYFEQCGR